MLTGDDVRPRSISPLRGFFIGSVFSHDGRGDVACYVSTTARWLVVFGEGVVEYVGVFAVHDVNRQLAGEAGQLLRAGVRHDRDGEGRLAARHGVGVLEGEAAPGLVRRSTYVLH